MYTVIDAHAHLWLRQDTLVDGLPIKTLTNGRSLFMGETRQMLPPFMLDGQNTAEVFLSNMDYAQVAVAVITQEYIDGNQSSYLAEIQKKYPERFLCCGLIDVWQPDYVGQANNAIEEGFRAIKIPANRIFSGDKRINLTDNNLMEVFALMQERQMILSIDLADGEMQVSEMQEVIASFPELKIAIGHFGMVTRAGWQEQIKLARHKNVRIESGGITWLFIDEFYPFTGAVWAIKEAISLVGIEKLMWGSDYPRTITAITYRMSYDFIIKSNLLSEEEKQMFLGENAIGFYGFNNLPQLPYIKNMCE
ncbi:MAG: amidohydrolase [Sphingobacteriales bacterium]|jgi:predicted TIM-barrel fold metal-dependent hydrolase|nr:amidohydrolase [Sphingobacteriales bacterium]